MENKKDVHIIIECLPTDIPPFSIVGSGDYAVCIDTNEQKQLHSSPKTWKIIKKITSEHDEELILEINKRKERLYHKGVHVTLSSNVRSLEYPPVETHPYIPQAIKKYNGAINSSIINYVTLYDEVYAPGQPFKLN